MTVSVTAHCVDRWHERVHPLLTRHAAKRALLRLLPAGEPRRELPWRDGGDADAFLVLSDGIALSLRYEGGRWIATSCLIRAGMGEEVRRRINEVDQSRRWAKRHRKLKERKQRVGRPDA